MKFVFEVAEHDRRCEVFRRKHGQPLGRGSSNALSAERFEGRIRGGGEALRDFDAERHIARRWRTQAVAIATTEVENRSGSCQAGNNRLWPPPICQLETRARQSVEREKRTMIAGASLGFLHKALFPRALFFELGLRRCSTDENEPALAAFDDRPF